MSDQTYTGDAAAIDGATFTAATSVSDVVGGVFNDSLANLSSGTSGAARMTAARAIHSNLRDASGNALIGQAAMAASIPVVLASNQSSIPVAGDTANNAADAGNPVKVGGVGNSSVPSAVTNGNRVNAWFSRNGALSVQRVDGAGNVMGGPLSDSDNYSPAAGFGDVAQSLLSAYDGSSYDRLRSTDALDAAPNVETGILAVGAGPGWDRKRNPSGVAATSTANAVTVTVDGADMIAFEVTTIGTTPGSMIFEVQSDDSTWTTAGMVVKLQSGPDVRVEGSFVPAVGDVYLVRTAGHRQVRYRVNATYASGTATVKWTAVNGVSMVKSLDMGPPPHNFGYAELSATAQYTTTQTSTTLGPTVSSTQRMVVTSIQIQAGATTAAAVQVYFGTGAYSRGTNKAIFDGEFAPSSTSKPGYAQSPFVPYTGAADEELKVTTSAGITLTVTIWYYLVAA